MSLKRDLLNAVLFKLKLTNKYDYFRGVKRHNKCEYTDNNKRIFFFMTPGYGNLGDQAIEIASTDFMFKAFGSEYKIIKISLEESVCSIYSIKEAIRKDDIIILQGGGNFGDLYLYIEEIRRFIVKSFPNNIIISFPSSINYNSDKELEKSKKIYNEHKFFLIIARDSFSYAFSKDAFSKCRNYLCPDIVLSMQNVIYNNKRDGVLVCLRNDKEKSSLLDRNKIISSLFEYYSNVVIYDTMSERKIDEKSKNVEVQSALNLFSKFSVVVTDRLHGMVFSAVTKTNCVVFPSMDHKIEGLYEWMNHDFIRLLKKYDTKSIIEEIDNLMIHRGDFEDSDILEEYKKLDVFLHNYINDSKEKLIKRTKN